MRRPKLYSWFGRAVPRRHPNRAQATAGVVSVGLLIGGVVLVGTAQAAPGVNGYIVSETMAPGDNSTILLDTTLQQSQEPNEPQVDGDTIEFKFVPTPGTMSGFWESDQFTFHAQDYKGVVLKPQSGATGSGTVSGTLRLLDVSRSDTIDQAAAAVTFTTPTPTPTSTTTSPTPTTTSPSPGTTTTTWTGNGSENANPACQDGQTANWHWILTPGGNNVLVDGTLTVHYTSGATTTTDGTFNGNGNGAMHFYVSLPHNDTVASASATFTYTGSGDNFVLTISSSSCSGTPTPTPTTSSPTPSPTTSTPTPTPTTSSPTPTPTSTSPAPQQVSFVLTGTRECTYPRNAHLNGSGNGAPNGTYYLTVGGKTFPVTADENGKLSFSGILSLNTKATVTLSWRLDDNMSNLGVASGKVTVPATANCVSSTPTPAPTSTYVKPSRHDTGGGFGNISDSSSASPGSNAQRNTGLALTALGALALIYMGASKLVEVVVRRK